MSKAKTKVIRPSLRSSETDSNSMKKANAADMKKQMKALNDKYEAKLKASMNPEQWQNWEKFRAEQKEKRKAGNAPQAPEQDID